MGVCNKHFAIWSFQQALGNDYITFLVHMEKLQEHSGLATIATSL
jgi:hypothetical protein